MPRALSIRACIAPPSASLAGFAMESHNDAQKRGARQSIETLLSTMLREVELDPSRLCDLQPRRPEAEQLVLQLGPRLHAGGARGARCALARTMDSHTVVRGAQGVHRSIRAQRGRGASRRVCARAHEPGPTTRTPRT
eukprot:4580171-Pleurochrysis_carterae.AAC.5